MKTREEVEVLKNSWLKDPIWDIYDTEGFEEYREFWHSFHRRGREGTCGTGTQRPAHIR